VKISIKWHVVHFILLFVVMAGIRMLLQVQAEAEEPAVNCPESDPNVVVRAEIKGIEVIRQDQTYITFRIHALFHLTNISTDPVFVLSGSELNYPFCGISIAKTKAQALSCLYVIYDSDFSSFSGDISPSVKNLYEKLDHEMPPADILRRIEPKAYWEFEKDGNFSISKFANSKYSRLLQGSNSLDEIRRDPHVWVQVKLGTWNGTFDLIDAQINRIPILTDFGRKLQERWRPAGHLVTNTLKSEPIELTLPLK